MALTVLTARDSEILTALARVPLATEQLVKLSQTFDDPFHHDRVLRRRMSRLADSGLVRRATYRALADRAGAPNYYLLTALGNRLLYGPDAETPAKRFGAAVAPTRERHTFALAEAIVHTLVAARRAGAEMKGFCRENSVQLSDGGCSIYPDAAFQLVTQSGERFSYFVELDNGTERLESHVYEETWHRKIMVYQAVRARMPTRFRVLIFATRSHDRLAHILDLANEHAVVRERTLFCGARLSEFTACDDALTQPLFRDHRGRTVALLAKPQQVPQVFTRPQAAAGAIALA